MQLLFGSPLQEIYKYVLMKIGVGQVELQRQLHPGVGERNGQNWSFCCFKRTVCFPGVLRCWE